MVGWVDIGTAMGQVGRAKQLPLLGEKTCRVGWESAARACCLYTHKPPIASVLDNSALRLITYRSTAFESLTMSVSSFDSQTTACVRGRTIYCVTSGFRGIFEQPAPSTIDIMD